MLPYVDKPQSESQLMETSDRHIVTVLNWSAEKASKTSKASSEKKQVSKEMVKYVFSLVSVTVISTMTQKLTCRGDCLFQLTD